MSDTKQQCPVCGDALNREGNRYCCRNKGCPARGILIEGSGEPTSSPSAAGSGAREWDKFAEGLCHKYGMCDPENDVIWPEAFAAITEAIDHCTAPLREQSAKDKATLDKYAELIDTAMACGHAKVHMLVSAETGEDLYCDLCDRNDQIRDVRTELTAERTKTKQLEHELVCAQDQYRDCHRDWQLERTRREAAERELKTVIDALYRAEDLGETCPVCRPNYDNRHEEACPILAAERFLAALRGKGE